MIRIVTSLMKVVSRFIEAITMTIRFRKDRYSLCVPDRSCHPLRHPSSQAYCNFAQMESVKTP
jgi:hypothetical protein